MTFLGLRGSRPPEIPALSLLDMNDDLDQKLKSAVQKHKDVSSWVIGRSLDAVDRTEEARISLKAIVDRTPLPGLKTAQGAFELISRGRNDDHS